LSQATDHTVDVYMQSYNPHMFAKKRIKM